MRDEKKQKGMVMIRRAVCLLLTFVLLWQFGGSLSASAGEKGSNFKPTEGKIKMIAWKRVRGDTNLPRNNNSPHYAYFAWPSGNNWYYLHTNIMTSWGKKTDSRWEADNAKAAKTIEDKEIARLFPQSWGYDTDLFYTIGSHGMPRLYYDGIDDDNGGGMTYDGYPMYQIQLSWWDENTGKYTYGNYVSFGTNSKYFYFRSSGWGTSWGIAPQGNYGAYSESADWDDSVALYHNRKNYDPVWRRRNGDHGMSLDWGKGYGFGSPVYLWIGYEEEKTAITANYTITNGSVLNIDGDVVIMDGVEITIEPGGVLSISGDVINNGIIKNYGTVILQEGATVTTFDPKYSLAGELQCYGSLTAYTKGNNKTTAEGKLVVMKDAVLAFDNGRGSLRLNDAAQLANYGTIVAPLIQLSEAFLENRGNLILGYDVQKLNTVANTRATETEKDGVVLSGGLIVNPDYSKAKSIIGNYEALHVNAKNLKWNNSKFLNYGVVKAALPFEAFTLLYQMMENRTEKLENGTDKTGRYVGESYSTIKNADLLQRVKSIK